MLIQIGETSKKHMKVLGIEQYPFTEKELKSKFRFLIKQNHSDTNKEISNEKTRQIIEAYNYLKNLCLGKDDAEKITEEEKNDMFDFWEVCPECNGKGKHKKFIRGGFEVCWHCFMKPRIIKCKCCNGTGKFKQKSGKVVNCYRCNGTGNFQKNHCSVCNDEGFIYVEPKTIVESCWKCDGKGKIRYEPMNPVIKKGSILK